MINTFITPFMSIILYIFCISIFFQKSFSTPLAFVGQDSLNVTQLRSRLFVFDPQLTSSPPSLSLTLKLKTASELPTKTLQSLWCRLSSQKSPALCVASGTGNNGFQIFAYDLDQQKPHVFMSNPVACTAKSANDCRTSLAFTNKYGFEVEFATISHDENQDTFYNAASHGVILDASNTTHPSISLNSKRPITFVTRGVLSSFASIPVPHLNAICLLTNEGEFKQTFLFCQDYDTSLRKVVMNITNLYNKPFNFPVCRNVPSKTPTIACFNNDASAPSVVLLDLTKQIVVRLPLLKNVAQQLDGRQFYGDRATITRLNGTSLLLIPASDSSASSNRSDLLAVFDVSPANRTMTPFLIELPGVARTEALSGFWPLGA